MELIIRDMEKIGKNGGKPYVGWISSNIRIAN